RSGSSARCRAWRKRGALAIPERRALPWRTEAEKAPRGAVNRALGLTDYCKGSGRACARRSTSWLYHTAAALPHAFLFLGSSSRWWPRRAPAARRAAARRRPARFAQQARPRRRVTGGTRSRCLASFIRLGP